MVVLTSVEPATDQALGEICFAAFLFSQREIVHDGGDDGKILEAQLFVIAFQNAKHG